MFADGKVCAPTCSSDPKLYKLVNGTKQCVDTCDQIETGYSDNGV